MRIVLDLQACQTEDRDLEMGRYALSLAQAIARQAHEHEIVIALNGRFPATVEPLRLAFDGLLPREQVVVFIVPESLAEVDPANAWRRQAAEQVRLSFLAELKPDIVHVSSLLVGLADDAVASAGSGHERFGSAATLSDADLTRLARTADEPLRAWRLRRLQEVKRTELLLATSDHARAQAITTLELPEERVVTVPAAAADGSGLLGLTPDEMLALQGRLGISKPFILSRADGADLEMAERLIHAFALLPETMRARHQLVVAALGARAREKLTAARARFGVRGDEAIIAGDIGHEGLAGLYGASTLMVFASESEWLGLSALTAMSCRAPTIAASTGAFPEVLGRADALFDPSDPHALATKIQQVLNDAGFRDGLRDHGSQQARRFSWDAGAVRTLEAFAQLHERRLASRTAAPLPRRPQPRPRLAFVSPLPPARSGIADYSAELLPELARQYDIDVVLHQDSLDDPWVAANAAQRSVPWFAAHAADYDRIVYQVGNSRYHEHMFALLARHPGVVVLHDFFLSHAVHHCEQTGQPHGAYARALYRSHGYRAIVEESHGGREAAIWKYPCNKEVLDRAEGVIVHSRFALQLADAWYGAGFAREWQYVPLLRAHPSVRDGRAARQRLGLGPSDFLVCSLGMLHSTKLNDRLLDAWLGSPLAADRRCFLAFVGETGGEYCEALIRTIEDGRLGGRVRVTGFAPRQLYEDYLAAADMAVQLRTLSRGETSAALLDCLAHGVPTIANTNGSAAELPEGTLLRLPDELSQRELVDALVRLRRDPGERDRLSRRGSEHVRVVHSPARAGDLYREAIERFAVDSPHARYRRLVRSLTDVVAAPAPTRGDLIDVAASVSANRSASLPRQLLVDITTLARDDLKTGIERVSRAVLKALLDRPLKGYRVEPVYDAGGYYAYARRFTLGLLGARSSVLHDAPIETGPGDVFLGLSACWDSIPQNRRWFIDFRNSGARAFFVMYDLLPALRPEVFPGFVQPAFAHWLDEVTEISDGIVCISRTVADELVDWLESARPQRAAPLRIGYFHLGADLAASLPSKGPQPHARRALRQMRTRPSFLMVGTIEPRKGHAQALAAFERLWTAGVQANLIIVGREGWGLEQLTKRLRTHPERGKRLLWLEGASDEMLLRFYESAVALLAASEGEGFGLPLVEAAKHGLPIIARDLPVFREVAGEHAFYFSGMSPEDLGAAISSWLALRERGEAPSSEGMPWLTWAQSTSQLLDVIHNGNWYARWPENPGADGGGAGACYPSAEPTT
jgi:glycosyltransferase involved in cell wall biosynthesis